MQHAVNLLPSSCCQTTYQEAARARWLPRAQAPGGSHSQQLTAPTSQSPGPQYLSKGSRPDLEIAAKGPEHKPTSRQ